MKKIYSILFLFSAPLLFAQIPNPSFENWTGGNPDGWNTLNSQISGSVTSSSSFPQNGSSYAVLETKELVVLPGFPGAAFPGVMTTGTIGQGNPTGGVPFTDTPQKIVGYYKYVPFGDDTATVNVTLQNAGNTIATGTFTSTNLVFSWTKFEVVLNYSNLIQPDKIIITCYSSATTPGGAKKGSKLSVDNLTTEGNALSTKSFSENNLKLYPTLATNELTLDLANNTSATSVSVVDLNGKVVLTKSIQSGVDRALIDISSLVSGMYLVKIQNNEFQLTKKIVKR
jgi:hypothetical protein